MLWSEIRKSYPNRWLIVEALEAHTDTDSQRQLDRLAVIETIPDGASALRRYRLLHKQYPHREFYFIHTSREQIEVREQQWLGIRGIHAADSQK